MTYVDTPDKQQKHPHYDHQTKKLDKKDNEFSSKEFHQVRKVSTPKKLLKSFGRIGMCLNDKSTGDIPTSDLDKVCFILMNNNSNKNKKFDVGPLNDGYLIGLYHHRLGYKVFYLYNSGSDEFKAFLGFFMRNTTISLIAFYSGLEKNENSVEGIKFVNGILSKSSIGEVISENLNCKANVVFLTDCIGGGSVFDIEGINRSNMISFYVSKTNSPESKECKRSHGVFTYYFCKLINECPSITPERLCQRINPSLLRFSQVFNFEFTNQKLIESPIYSN